MRISSWVRAGGIHTVVAASTLAGCVTGARTLSTDRAGATLEPIKQLLDRGDRISLFLDFDGTLLEIADSPDAIHVDASLPALLARTHAALDGALPSDIRESVLASISPRQRRMIESDLTTGVAGINPREIAIARRAVAQEAIRLASSGQIELKDKEGGQEAAA